MSALDEAIKHVDPPQKDEGWIEYGLMLLWSEIDGYEHVADNASEEIVGLREQLAALTQRLEAAEAERDALMHGVVWALGYTDFGIGEPDEKPAFWWRKRLRDITGITEDKVSQFLRGDT